MPSTTRPHWNGDQVKAAVALLVNRDGIDCWLCHHPTHRRSRSIDHVIPYTHRPDLDRLPTNWRLAHLHPANTPRGCDHPGCTCTGNTGRRAAPATPPPSRRW